MLITDLIHHEWFLRAAAAAAALAFMPLKGGMSALIDWLRGLAYPRRSPAELCPAYVRVPSANPHTLRAAAHQSASLRAAAIRAGKIGCNGGRA